MIRSRTPLVATVLIALIALSGCGGSDGAKSADITGLSAKAILAKAKAQVNKETNVSVDGTTSESGSEIGVKFDYSGQDSTGTITIDGAVLTLLNVGGVKYFKADDAFWKTAAGDQGATISAAVNGHWIKASANSNFADLLSLADRSFLSTEVLKPDGTLTKGSKKNVNGVSCIGLKDGDTGTLYVAAGNARPIKIVSKSKGGGGLIFSYTKLDTPAAPDAADVIDESQLG